MGESPLQRLIAEDTATCRWSEMPDEGRKLGIMAALDREPPSRFHKEYLRSGPNKEYAMPRMTLDSCRGANSSGAGVHGDHSSHCGNRKNYFFSVLLVLSLIGHLFRQT